MNGRLLILALVLAAFSLQAGAGEIDHAREYRACMILVKRSPDEAFESAMAWRDMGGGAPAKHCVAAALLGLGQHEESAKRFEELAQEIKGKPLFKAELLGQASQAWLLGNKPERAEATVTTALKINPKDKNLLVDRAMARAAVGRYKGALIDLNAAIKIDPYLTDAYAFRASAYRFLGNLDLAKNDVERALMYDMRHTGGLLERGIILRLRGDSDGARQDWLNVISSAPGTIAARAARANLEKMDVTGK